MRLEGRFWAGLLRIAWRERRGGKTGPKSARGGRGGQTFTEFGFGRESVPLARFDAERNYEVRSRPGWAVFGRLRDIVILLRRIRWQRCSSKSESPSDRLQLFSLADSSWDRVLDAPLWRGFGPEFGTLYPCSGEAGHDCLCGGRTPATTRWQALMFWDTSTRPRRISKNSRRSVAPSVRENGAGESWSRSRSAPAQPMRAMLPLGPRDGIVGSGRVEGWAPSLSGR